MNLKLSIKIRYSFLMCLILANTLILSGCQMTTKVSEEQLIRVNYQSQVNNTEREYFVYLPKGYHSQLDKKWPVLLFLHGNGERGNGKDELDYVLMHGPLYEAWIQKKDIPFVIISPQLHMFDFDKRGINYIDERSKSDIPQRLDLGTAPRLTPFVSTQSITRSSSKLDMSQVNPLLPLGWEQVEADLLYMIENTLTNYHVNEQKVYLTGLSYGGFGTWYMASKYPEKFTAIAPVVGWGHPSLMAPIAEHKIPVWQFAGGKDNAVPIQYFYSGLDKLLQLGHQSIRFTVYEELGHDAWKRVYASDDFYNWLLSQ